MTTLTTDNQTVDNAADHAAAAVHALSHMSTNAQREPSGKAISSAARIVAHVADHGIVNTADGLTVKLEEFAPLLDAAGIPGADGVVDAPVVELDQQAREYLTIHMVSGEPVAIAHAGGEANFRVVAIAADHAKVRQLRDVRGPLPTRTLHYETIDEAGYGHVDTTADLTPATVYGHKEYREQDRQLAQDLSSTLGNLDHVARAAQGHDIVSKLVVDQIRFTADSIRRAMSAMRDEAERENPAPTFAVGDRVECVGDPTILNYGGTGTITFHAGGDLAKVRLDHRTSPLYYRVDQLTKISDPLDKLVRLLPF